MKLFCTVFIISSLGICLSTPVEHLVDLDSDPEMTDGYFEGDIILDINRNGMRNDDFRWPNGTVYYVLDDIFDEEHRNHILLAMSRIEEVSCIRFEEVSRDYPYYVFIKSNNTGCQSNVGWLNSTQLLNLEVYPMDTGCFILGKIIHELLHTLGFRHMQSNWNRDEYVLIVEENIFDDKLFSFDKYDKNVIDDFGEEYDYASMMHYQPKAFSKNGLPTIVPLRELAPGVMGQRHGLTQSDINKINLMYRCPKYI